MPHYHPHLFRRTDISTDCVTRAATSEIVAVLAYTPYIAEIVDIWLRSNIIAALS